jgi:hypothetical protein
MMAVYSAKLPHDTVLAALRTGGYAGPGVVVYYRVKGTDQVVYAYNGRIAPGQALDEAQLSPQTQMETVVLMHPQDGQTEAITAALMSLGSAEVMYEGATLVAGRETGETPEGGTELQVEG